jgi:type IV secretory pathway TraG/TraD family ATPase VirD4
VAGVVGGPRTHKTAGVLVPNVVAHEGPVVVASVKRDVLQATVRHRQTVAETSGGPLYGVAPRVHV